MKPSRIRRWIWRPIGAGLLVLLPVGLVIMILAAVFRFSDQILSPMIHGLIHLTGRILNIPFLTTIKIPGLGLIVLLGFLFAAGALSLSRLGKNIIRFFEKRIARIPVAGTIYLGAQDLIRSLFGPDSLSKRVPVLVEPQPGQRMIGFLTGETKLGQDGRETELMAVYIPNTPNLVSGILMFLSPAQITRLEMTPEQAMKLIISGGLTVEPNLKPKK